jgi:hypothetical protein
MSEIKKQKLIGILFVLGVISVSIPYTILTITFQYPKILRLPVSEILQKFSNGGPSLVFTWWLFAIGGLTLFFAYNLLGSLLRKKIWYADLILQFGTIACVLQIVGLLRWTFIVPLLANFYTAENSPYSKESVELVFIVIHQLGGVILGEHLGQIFTILWIFLISYGMYEGGVISRKSKHFAQLGGLIYLFAQLELIKTIFPNTFTIKFAGLLGSTIWLIWMLWIGIHFLSSKKSLVE